MDEVEAINYMENEIKCIKMASRCDRDCARCELVKEEEPLLNSFGVAIRALERRIAKKPLEGGIYHCSHCMFPLKKGIYKYCPDCGQKVDWG